MRTGARILIGLVVIYGAFYAIVLWAMCQPPSTFGRFMRYTPNALVFGALPAEKMWLWARAGHLNVGDVAPDFTLPLLHGDTAVTLSSFRGQRPVVLVFGSYT